MDAAKHHKTECCVNGANKHRFTCLNKTCLLHSWICREHIDENGPQDTEPGTVWRSLLPRLDITSCGFTLERVISQTTTLQLAPSEPPYPRTSGRKTLRLANGTFGVKPTTYHLPPEKLQMLLTKPLTQMNSSTPPIR